MAENRSRSDSPKTLAAARKEGCPCSARFDSVRSGYPMNKGPECPGQGDELPEFFRPIQPGDHPLLTGALFTNAAVAPPRGLEMTPSNLDEDLGPNACFPPDVRLQTHSTKPNKPSSVIEQRQPADCGTERYQLIAFACKE
jgi:hypothetical protein